MPCSESQPERYQPTVGFDSQGYWCARCGALREPCVHFPQKFVASGPSLREKELAELLRYFVNCSAMTTSSREWQIRELMNERAENVLAPPKTEASK
jgi:hypothetical protein